MHVITVNQQSNRARVGSDIVLVNGWGISSGLGPVDLENDRAPLPEGIERQTAKILSNLEILLKAAGLNRGNVVAVRVYTGGRPPPAGEDECRLHRLLCSRSSAGADRDRGQLFDPGIAN